MPTTELTILDEAYVLAQALKDGGVDARIMGGAGVALHCPPLPNGQQMHREIGDIDFFLGSRRETRDMGTVLGAHGYHPDAQFNALNGRERLIFHSDHWKIDVFIHDFTMCHVIPLANRVSIDWPTLSVTDLLLTKLQVAEFTDKDRSDVIRLLSSHPLAHEDGDVVNAGHLCAVIAKDWGLWRTLTYNLSAVADAEPALAPKVEALLKWFDQQPKSTAFRLRAMLGERVRWYEVPEESLR